MRILYVSGDRGVPVFGRKGASTHVREMIAALRGLGHEVQLAAANLDGDRRPLETFPTRTWIVPTARILGSDVRALWASWEAGRALREVVAGFQPDAIYERSSLYFTAGERLAATLGVPRILEVNTFLAEEQHTRLHFPRWAARIEHSLFRNAPAIAAISPVLRERLLALGIPAERVRVFSMAVDPARFVARGARDQTLQDAGINPSQRTLGFVGSMNHYHKPTVFAELLERVLPKHDDLSAIFVGGSDSKIERLQHRLAPWVDAKRVLFVGTVRQELLRPWMEAMDLIVVPGAAPQSTPTKIFEAAALGRPMLLPDTVPIRNICANGAEGVLFPEDDLDALHARVMEWRRDPAPIEAASAALRHTVLTNHTWQNEAAKAVAWFEELKSK